MAASLVIAGVIGPGRASAASAVSAASQSSHTGWEQTPLPILSANLVGVAGGRGPNEAWATGFSIPQSSQLSALAVHWNGTSWAQTSTSVLPDDSRLFSLDAVTPTDIWSGGVINGAAGLAHWDGHAWHAVVPTPSKRSVTLTQ